MAKAGLNVISVLMGSSWWSVVVREVVEPRPYNAEWAARPFTDRGSVMVPRSAPSRARDTLLDVVYRRSTWGISAG
jgi:hypothetical protein